MFPRNQFGHFADGNETYRVTDPMPPGIWWNAITNDSGVVMEVTHWGTQTLNLNYPALKQNCEVAVPNHTWVYCRDEDTGRVWNPGVAPMMSEVKDFACEHHDGWTSVASVFDGLRVVWRTFAPVSGRRVIWTVEVHNETPRPRRVSVFPVVAPNMVNFQAPRFFFGPFGTASYDESLRGVFYRVGNPHAPWEARHLLLCGSRTPDDACGDRAHLFGPVLFPQYPQRLISGGALGRRGGGSSGWHTDMVLALQFKMDLAPSGSGRCDMLLAAVRDKDEARAMADEMAAPEAAEREFRGMCEARQARRSTMRIRTPDAQLDAFANAWLKRGLEYSLIKKDSTRDNLQFADGLTMSDPARVRAELLRLMPWQYADGHAIRSWIPYDETWYSDTTTWLVMTACGYVKFTDDLAFLNERAPYFDGGEGTVLEHLERAVAQLDGDRGPHGLPRFHYADWNDALNPADPDSESVFVAMQLGCMFNDMAGLMRRLGRPADADRYAQKHAALKRTVNEAAWDEEGGYYVRGFADGKVIGGSRSEGSTIFVNPQSWAIMADLVPAERLPRLLAVVDEKLEWDLGCPVNTPLYSKQDPRLGRITFQIPGSDENGVYCHATAFKTAADVWVGRGDAALRCLKKVTPDYEGNPVAQSGALPFALTSAYSVNPATPGRASRSWLTGSACWYMRSVVEGLLGVRRAYGGFVLRPAFPSTWPEAEITLQRGSETYRIRIERSAGVAEQQITVNGAPLKGDFLPFQPAGIHEVIIRLPGKAG